MTFMIENCSVIFYARDGCESFYTAKTQMRHRTLLQFIEFIPD
jgi:hypothetical protein